MKKVSLIAVIVWIASCSFAQAAPISLRRPTTINPNLIKVPLNKAQLEACSTFYRAAIWHFVTGGNSPRCETNWPPCAIQLGPRVNGGDPLYCEYDENNLIAGLGDRNLEVLLNSCTRNGAELGPAITGSGSACPNPAAGEIGITFVSSGHSDRKSLLPYFPDENRDVICVDENLLSEIISSPENSGFAAADQCAAAARGN